MSTYLTQGWPVKARAVLVPVALMLIVLSMVFDHLFPWVMQYPESLEVPVQRELTVFSKWLMDELDFGLFTFRELTRAIVTVFELPMVLVRGVLAKGFMFYGETEDLQIPAVSWISVVAVSVLIAYRIKGTALATFVGAVLLYFASFGLWDSAMMTLSSVLVSVPLGVALGILLGIWAFRNRKVEKVLTPIFDVMQTTPIFAYLVPALAMFGYGPGSAVIVTMIYAMPPMARVTILGLRGVPAEIVELSHMLGCSNRQIIWKVMLPSARPTLMVGVNQVIMLSLNMVIIASLIGAGGLGFNIWQALQKLFIGAGVEAGVAITLMAIALDRISQAYASRSPTHQITDAHRRRRYWTWFLVVIFLVVPTPIGYLVPSIGVYPEFLKVTTGLFWDNVVDWINLNLYFITKAVKTWTVLNVLRPFKAFLLAVPWLGVIALIAALGFRLGGIRLALTVTCIATAIAMVGLWDRAMISLYLAGVGLMAAALIGIPLGIYAAWNDNVNRVLQVIIDAVQTLPTFVYLIPIVMLFKVGDFSGLMAISLYALAPAVRYTNLGIRLVPPDLIEAARAAGCSNLQILTKVQLRLALPEIMLGLNQTLMMALSMLVISALVGTRGLEQETLEALSYFDTGKGVVAGLAVAGIAIIVDRLVSAWSRRRKLELGLPV